MTRERSNVIEFSCFRRDSKTGALRESKATFTSEGLRIQEESSSESVNNIVYLQDQEGHRYALVTQKGQTGSDSLAWRPDGAVEASAIPRLHGILRQMGGLSILLQGHSSPSRGGRIVSLSNAAMPYFIVECEHFLDSKPGQDFRVDLDLYGMRFSFISSVIEVDSDARQIALNLPDQISRKMTRSAPRKNNVQIDIEISGRNDLSPHLIDISVNGLAFKCQNEEKCIPTGEQIDLVVRIPGKRSYNLCGLVVGRSKNTHHISLAIQDTDRKSWVADILEIQYPGLKFHYNADRAWQCLIDFGYLDLIETAEFKIHNSACRKTWHDREKDPDFFQPVVEREENLGGTYGIVRQTQDHWVQQCLATRVDPGFIPVTHALYSAWPQYVLTENAPRWITTQFDSEKRWHNRFFGVFAEEVRDDPQFTRFYRHWHWSCQLRQVGLDAEVKRIPFDEASSDLKAEALEIIKPYSKSRNPWFELDLRTHGEHQTQSMLVVRGEQLIGIILFFLSKNPVNPFGVFHVGHVFAAPGSSETRAEATKILLCIANNELAKTGLSSAALTHEYDVDPKVTDLQGYSYFCCTELQVHTELLIPIFLSVAALNSADMELRHGKKSLA